MNKNHFNLFKIKIIKTFIAKTHQIQIDDVKAKNI